MPAIRLFVSGVGGKREAGDKHSNTAIG